MSAIDLLSAVPWFDDALASELLGPEGVEDAGGLLASIKQSGVLVERDGLWRIPEPMRSDLRGRLLTQDRPTYVAALELFSSHARNGMGGSLELVMGRHGAYVNTEVIAYLVGEASGEGGAGLKRLVAVVREDGERYKSAASRDVSRLLSVYGAHRGRAATFFMALSLWARGRRVEAVANFQTVLDEPTRDIAAAISAHLVAVALYGDGALDEAKNRVELSVSIGREIEDERGLAFTLSTLGRVELALSNRTGSVEAARRAITALDEATKYAENYDVLGRTLQYLAEAQLKIGHGEDAQRLGYEAIEISQYGERAVEARTAAALIERELGNESSYQALLSDAEEIAARDGVGGRSLAKLLNMEASSRRRSGDMSGALALAKRSLALGRRLNDRRHVAHAAHTLAAITIDLLPVSSDIPADLDEARKLLEESRTALVRLRDARGIQLVDASLRRLSSAAALAEFTTDES